MAGPWQVLGYASGAGTMAIGAAFLAGHGRLSIGLTCLAVGATTVTMAALAGNLNRPKKPNVTLTPLLVVDAEGSLAPGVGLSVVSF